jgi:hypothetical protein
MERDGRLGARPAAIRRRDKEDCGMPDERTIWKRRAALMAVVGLIVAVPLTIALGAGDDEDPDPASLAAEPATPMLGQLERNRRLGVRLRLPDDWKRKQRKAGGAVAYRSGDGTVLVAISAPGPADDADSIQKAAVGAIKDQYRAVDVVDTTSRSRLGRRPAETAAIAARNPKTRDPVRILVSTAKGRKRAYLVEVFAAGADPNAALVEAQVVLNDLRLQG